MRHGYKKYKNLSTVLFINNDNSLFYRHERSTFDNDNMNMNNALISYKYGKIYNYFNKYKNS